MQSDSGKIPVIPVDT